MDPKNSSEHASSAAPNPGYTLILVAFLLKTASWMVGVITDGSAPLDDQSSRSLRALTDLLSGPLINVACVIMIVMAGFFLSFWSGWPSEHETSHGKAKPAKVATLPMTETARAAEARLNGLIAQFRSMPENMVSAESSVEFERIESKHLPDLMAAHRQARATTTPTSHKADALDADYAGSMDRLSAKLARLIEGCEALGRERLEVQSRFIEARHPGE